MPINLEGRCVFVTGSTQGVGRAIALACASAGADVMLHGLTIDEQARNTLAECRAMGSRAELIAADLSGPTVSVIQSVYDQATRAFSAIDLLVNNAGTYADEPFLELSYESFERTMRLNVFSYFFLTQAFARRWVRDQIDGRVVMIGSINGRLAEPVHSGYDTSKGAVEMMVKTLCVELAPHNIRVNGIAPGLFVTPLTADGLREPRARKWMQHHTPNGKIPDASVAGDAAVFLLSDAASHIHGQMLLIDGGMSAWQQPEADGFEFTD